MNDDDSRVSKLIASAQESIADLPSMPDYRNRRVHIGFARVQALCAIAAAIDRLVDAITKETE